jgi:hypothetical protein
MKIFSNIYNYILKILTERFPSEDGLGSLKIEGNILVSNDTQGRYTHSIIMDDIQYVYITKINDEKPYLHIFDAVEKNIPVNFYDFKKIYKLLSAKFGFDDNAFFYVIHKLKEGKAQLWRKIKQPTYEILIDEVADYEKGFEILSPQPQFISWDMSYAEFVTKKDLAMGYEGRDLPVTYFNYPIRIGKIKLYNFSARFYSRRTDVPCLHFNAECYNSNNTAESLHELLPLLINTFPITEKYDNEHYITYRFDFEGMIFSLGYSMDSIENYNRGCSFISIENKRDYPELLIDEEYEHLIEISDYILLKHGAKSNSDYKNTKAIKRKPPKVLDLVGNAPIIWVDKKNLKIGFSNGQFSELMNINDIAFFEIRNAIPARFKGGAYLNIITAIDNAKWSVFWGDCYCFDEIAEILKQITGKDVVLAQPYNSE